MKKCIGNICEYYDYDNSGDGCSQHIGSCLDYRAKQGEDMKPCKTQQCSFHDITADSGCNKYYLGDCRCDQYIDNCQNYTTMKGGDMKRYNPRIVYPIDAIIDLDKCDTEFNEDPNGEWVKYEDVKDILQPDKWIRNGFGQWGVCTCDTTPCTCRAPICNCEKMSQRGWPQNRIDYWICPAHGYKRR